MYLIPLFTLAIRRTDEISNALHTRGYTPLGKIEGGGKRSDYILTKYPFRTIDQVLIYGMIGLFILIIVLRAFGYFSIDTDPLRAYIIALASGASQ
jgi:energy-coupling factor transporter transmembrane protein EcfT